MRCGAGNPRRHAEGLSSAESIFRDQVVVNGSFLGGNSLSRKSRVNYGAEAGIRSDHFSN
jgi:hypothetical protein